MNRIRGGYIIKARVIHNSKIMGKPPHYRELWDLLLFMAYPFEKIVQKRRFERGMFFTSIKEVQTLLEWKEGFIKKNYSYKQLWGALQYLEEEKMIETKRTARGLVIRVINYDYYQDPANYQKVFSVRKTENHKFRFSVPPTLVPFVAPVNTVSLKHLVFSVRKTEIVKKRSAHRKSKYKELYSTKKPNRVTTNYNGSNNSCPSAKPPDKSQVKFYEDLKLMRKLPPYTEIPKNLSLAGVRFVKIMHQDLIKDYPDFTSLKQAKVKTWLKDIKTVLNKCKDWNEVYELYKFVREDDFWVLQVRSPGGFNRNLEEIKVKYRAQHRAKKQKITAAKPKDL